MNWPIFSLNFVPVGAGSSRMARSGKRRVAILESREKGAVIISRFRLGDTWHASFIGAQIAARNFRASVACLACCRAHNGGEFDARFRLRLVSSSGGL